MSQSPDWPTTIIASVTGAAVAWFAAATNSKIAAKNLAASKEEREEKIASDRAAFALQTIGNLPGQLFHRIETLEGERDQWATKMQEVLMAFSRIQEEQDDLKERHAQEIETLRQAHAGELAALRATHEKDIEALRADYERQMDELRKKIELVNERVTQHEAVCPRLNGDGKDGK